MSIPKLRIGNKEQADLLLSDYAAVALRQVREPIFDEFLKVYARLRERDIALTPFDENGSPPPGEPSQDKDGHVTR